ncbi:hypothetical protein FQR65_LT20574 [Abscondita terminalis]|nr:hypothetical protein FQR65_LT20574 [Abscondita terminalis]
MQVIIPTNLTGGPDSGMSLWDGTFDEDGNLEWDQQDRGANGQNGVFVEGANYYAYFSSFGWTNVDRFYNDPRPKTTILAEAPEGLGLGPQFAVALDKTNGKRIVINPIF